MPTDDPEDGIAGAVERSNPRREGESSRAWKTRLSGITSRAVKRYWNDIREIVDEAGVDTDGARKMYRDALKALDAERSETTRSEIVRIVAESIEEKAEEAKPAEEESIWMGEEQVFDLMTVAERAILDKLSAGHHDYEASEWVYRGSRLVAREDVLFGASPSEWFYNYHEASRDFLNRTLGKKTSPTDISFTVTEVRILG